MYLYANVCGLLPESRHDTYMTPRPVLTPPTQPHTRQRELVMPLFPTWPEIHPHCQFQQSIPHSPVNRFMYSCDKYYRILAMSLALYPGGTLQIKVIKADMDLALTGLRMTVDLTPRVILTCQICSIV